MNVLFHKRTENTRREFLICFGGVNESLKTKMNENLRKVNEDQKITKIKCFNYSRVKT